MHVKIAPCFPTIKDAHGCQKKIKMVATMKRLKLTFFTVTFFLLCFVWSLFCQHFIYLLLLLWIRLFIFTPLKLVTDSAQWDLFPNKHVDDCNPICYLLTVLCLKYLFLCIFVFDLVQDIICFIKVITQLTYKFLFLNTEAVFRSVKKISYMFLYYI